MTRAYPETVSTGRDGVGITPTLTDGQFGRLAGPRAVGVGGLPELYEGLELLASSGGAARIGRLTSAQPEKRLRGPMYPETGQLEGRGCEGTAFGHPEQPGRLVRTTMTAADKSGFWVFSYAAGLGSRAAEERRWCLATNLTLQQLETIRYQEGPIPAFDAPLTAEAERPHDVEDVPFVYQNFYVVSHRVRDMVEEAGPGDCQFLAIDIRYRGESLGLTYWVMRAMWIIDCADPERSYNVNKPGEVPLYMRARIIPSKVPPEVSTFRIRFGTHQPIVRDALRRRMLRAKVSGALFYPP